MISCKLRELLDGRDMTRYELSKISGITYPTIHALYRNKSKFFSAKVLDKLCRALRCKTGDILRWDPERFPRYKISKRKK
jgi:putative transcriptional regulator